MNAQDLTLFGSIWAHWLSWTILIPVLGALAIAIVPKDRHTLMKGIALVVSLIVFVMGIAIWFSFDPDTAAFQMTESMRWIPGIGASYLVGIDGMSMILVVLTAFLTPIALLGTWTSVTEKMKGYTASILMLEAGMIGVFVARDLFLFYIFWEAMLIPMYLLIGVWGGPRRIYAAVKFILYTLVGSFLMLIAILALYFLHGKLTGVYTFDLAAFEQIAIPFGAQTWLFLAFTFAFCIKVPLWPFHTWLPDAHVEAPTFGSVILAGVLLKMGTYGLLRFSLPLFPVAATLAVPYLATLSIIGITYGGLVAWVQKDIKSLVAYSSVAHLGFVVLGIFTFRAEGLSGSMLQMVNHGLSTGALFILVGYIYQRRHTRQIDDFGGLAKVMPIYAAILLVVAFSSAGLPGLNGFVGEFLILIAAFQVSPWMAIPAIPGIIIAALYLLRMLRGVLWGPLDKEENKVLKDLNLREILTMVPLLVLIVMIGIFPKPFLRPLEPVAAKIEKRMNSVRQPVRYVIETPSPGDPESRDTLPAVETEAPETTPAESDEPNSAEMVK